MSAAATFARLREYMVGPTRFMILLSCFELGLVDALRDRPHQSAAQLGEAVGAAPDAVEQLLHLPVKEGFIARDERSGTYALDAFADIPEAHLEQVLSVLDMIKVVMLRQGFYLTESVRTGTLVGLDRLYGFQGNLYEAVAEHKDLRESWATMMDGVTTQLDPWFFRNVHIPAGSRVLDLAGNTGLGAILTYRMKATPGLRVTTFDLPEKEQECLENFRTHGVAEHCSFLGGDVFAGVPRGFDVVLVKHFLDMFDKRDVLRILGRVSEALDVGGQVNILVPVYPDDIRDPGSAGVDIFPAYFLGCTMGQGGPQKLSTYRSWVEECGFRVTKALAQDLSSMPGALISHGILCATKVA
ncbi:acetylserotonin O-methyltransferase [Actinokineospora sp. PR83]|uniref:acetylserotonin O-methyltransferase n=1 Tax=Actinokineospora sp. PR83 TaxID=2884908 RepID=UPI001F3A20E7|nr:acetylserotonin O-methyltransferase [Actinokineospora sp. PR83]MCG8915905.1 acetylserotonin O-methyltransferase [Actinokineospora sp. PR83]